MAPAGQDAKAASAQKRPKEAAASSAGADKDSQPPAKRAKGEEQDPALTQALADGSVVLPKKSSGSKPAASATPPGKEPLPPGGSRVPKGGKKTPPPPEAPAKPKDAPVKGKAGLQKPPKSGGPPPVVVPPVPKPVKASGASGSSSGATNSGGPSRAGTMAPKGMPQIVKPPPNVTAKKETEAAAKSKGAGAAAAQLVPPPPPAKLGAIQGMLSSRMPGVPVPPPPHMAQKREEERQQEEAQRQQQEYAQWLEQMQRQEEEWRRQEEDLRKAWEEECRLFQAECRRQEEEEKARQLEEQRLRQEAFRQEQEAVALQLQGELAALLNVAEDKVEKAKAMGDSIQVKDGMTDEEIIKVADEFEVHAVGTRRAIKACSDFMGGKYQRLQGNTETTRQEAVMFLQRFKTAEKDIEQATVKVRARKRESIVKRDKEAKRLSALQAAEKQESLFKKYDVDEDGVLSVREVGAFVKGECNFDLPQEKVEGILKSEAFAGSDGVAKDKFAQLRLLVGVASVVGALSGMEAEVAKAEEKAKPLAVRGMRPMPMDVLEERIDEVDSAVDAARDYLAAAREQVQGLELEPQPATLAPTAVRMATQEARKLGTRLDWFEQRLARAGAASKASRDRLVLQQKKAELMRAADEAARGY